MSREESSVQDATHRGPRDELDRCLRGDALGPDDEGYDRHRLVWNGRFARRPALIARCAGVEDVSEAVRFARAHDLEISVRGGGHDYAGNTVRDGSLLVDLGRMRAVTVDADARRASVGAGATWAEVDGATQAHGLATPGATVSSVGVAGFTLGGGEGWLARLHGLAADNLLGAELVTASGDVVSVDADENADLLWGLRGGGGNLGIVTRFDYALHEVGPEIVAGQVMYPAERGRELLAFFRDHMRAAPPELMAYAFFLRVPPLDVFPAEYHGRVVLDFVVAWLGPVEDGEAMLAPFRGHGPAVFDLVGPQPYVTLQTAFDAGISQKGNRWYTRAHYLDELSDAAIDTVVSGVTDLPGDFTIVYLGAGGGAQGGVAPDATAFPHRSASFSLHVFPGWSDEADDEAVMRWARGLSDRVAPETNGGVYVNLLADDEADRVRAAYGPNYERLARLKAKWDPDNVFRSNHNVPPRG